MAGDAWRRSLRVPAILVSVAPVFIGGCGGDAAMPDASNWRIEEEFRIGVVVGDGPDLFGAISALAVEADGTIHLFDGQAVELRTFGPDGAFLRRFGRRGAGPGEFRTVIGLDVAPDGALWLVDPINARYTVLRENGEFREYQRPSPVYRLPWIGGFGDDGSFYDGVVLPGETRETVLRFQAPEDEPETFEIAEPDIPQPRMGSITLPLPYSPRHLRAFDRRGAVWTGNTHEYRFSHLSPAGDTLLVAGREGAPPLLDAEQRDTVRAAVRQLRDEFGVGIRDEMIPTRSPLIRWFIVDDEGRLWVAPADGERDDPVLDLYDAEGGYLGQVPLPFRLMGSVRPVIQGDRLTAVIEDEETGVPVVVRGKLIRR